MARRQWVQLLAQLSARAEDVARSPGFKTMFNRYTVTAGLVLAACAAVVLSLFKMLFLVIYESARAVNKPQRW